MHLYSLWILACSFVVVFSCSFLIWPWCEGITGLLKWVWVYSFLINIFEKFDKDFHSFLFKYLIKLSETIWPMLFYVGKSLITESILLLICSNFLFLHDSVMVVKWSESLMEKNMKKNTYVYTCTHICMPAKSVQLSPTLCDPIECNLPRSSVHRILQARIL